MLFDNPVQPVLAMPVDPSQWRWSASMADSAARWRIYLHQLGQAALIAWCQEEFDGEVAPLPHGAPFDIWHVVEGLALQLGDARIVVILSETIDAAELRVPQEWVDLSPWRGDYYLAAYVDVDAQQLVLWGYTPYAQLKSRSTYDATQRIYCLQDTDMVQDFSAFWVAQQFPSPPTPGSGPLTPPSVAQANSLIQRLAHSLEPRLELPFTQWGGLISCDQWRQRLYQRRQRPLAVNIADWLENIFENDWQPLEALLPETSAPQLRSVVTSTAVLTCGKKVSLSTVPDDLLLMFSVDIETENRRNIRIQLYPSNEALLPRQVVLTLELAETGQLLKQVKAGKRDNFIQIPPFRCSAGQLLRVNIQLNDSTCTEDFIS